jgi:hypothetical protein
VRRTSPTRCLAGFQHAPQQRALSALLTRRPSNISPTPIRRTWWVERPDLRALSDDSPARSASSLRLRTGTPADVDAVVTGRILESKVTSESKQTGHGESTYQDGFRAEPNPDHVRAAAAFSAALEKLEDARRRLAQRRRDWSTTGHRSGRCGQ